MTVYLDTSVVLSWLLNQDPSIEEWGGWQSAYTSEICRVEFHRTIDRLRLDGDLDDTERVFVHERFATFWRSVYRVRVSGALLTRASQPYPTVVGTLDCHSPDKCTRRPRQAQPQYRRVPHPRRPVGNGRPRSRVYRSWCPGRRRPRGVARPYPGRELHHRLSRVRA